ncbi:expressed unknown protein [Seminavis robusta]|uniref:Uncharacterized protein n=1 Tax=Seminavis robusta TaxID=568900 RepID=A0A9N8HAA8_9STRA|nr:expressed unknown protein [Seminavis robusta]|eukprot:Sro142_g066100.1 n/a (265) ;mRNA; r:21470-22264
MLMKERKGMLLLLLPWVLCISAVGVSAASNGTTTDALVTATDTNAIVQCSLCGDDPSWEPLDRHAKFDGGGGDYVTCGHVHSLGFIALPPQNCSFLQGWGAGLCQCAPASSLSETTQKCRLCETGFLKQGQMAGFPSISCASSQVQASRDQSVPCHVYQATVGEYCGCHNPKATANMCRICGGDNNRPLPDPLKFIPRHASKSCGELEFDANVPNADCRLFQKLYGEQCCPPVIEDNSAAAAVQTLTIRWFVGLVSAMLLVHYY